MVDISSWRLSTTASPKVSPLGGDKIFCGLSMLISKASDCRWLLNKPISDWPWWELMSCNSLTCLCKSSTASFSRWFWFSPATSFNWKSVTLWSNKAFLDFSSETFSLAASNLVFKSRLSWIAASSCTSMFFMYLFDSFNSAIFWCNFSQRLSYSITSDWDTADCCLFELVKSLSLVTSKFCLSWSLSQTNSWFSVLR